MLSTSGILQGGEPVSPLCTTHVPPYDGLSSRCLGHDHGDLRKPISLMGTLF